jgi:multidrug efflux system outer membrane protein
MPIFDPRIWLALKASKVENEILLAQYDKAIQTAFREIADALAVQGTVEKQLTAQQALVDATDEAFRLADIRYRQGVDNYLTVLDAQRTLYAAQQGLVSQRLTRVANLVQLYGAMGGGWYEKASAPGDKNQTAQTAAVGNPAVSDQQP